jgi:hypothetical protein
MIAIVSDLNQKASENRRLIDGAMHRSVIVLG